MVKPSLIGDAKDSPEARRSRAILVRVLDRTLRLLHPFMPFLTEEIWQKLPHEGETLVLAPFPRFRPEEADEEAEKEIAFLTGVVGKLRNLRSESGIDPGRKLEAVFLTDLARPRRIVADHRVALCTLARLSDFRFVSEIPADLAAARGVVPGLEMAIVLSGAVDSVEERRRLSRESERAARELAALEAKLANDSFVQRAPAEVVERVRSERAELAAKLEKLTRNLASLHDPEAGSRP
jgi:valyl-tRNA synthetase